MGMPSGLRLQRGRELFDTAQRVRSPGPWFDKADGLRFAITGVVLGAAVDKPSFRPSASRSCRPNPRGNRCAALPTKLP